MSWRTVVITKTSKIDYSMGHLVVRDVESTTKIHISEICAMLISLMKLITCVSVATIYAKAWLKSMTSILIFVII